MTESIGEIAFLHLGKEEALDIAARAADQDVRIEEEEGRAGAYGEPALFCAVLVLTTTAIKAYIEHVKYIAKAMPDESLTATVVVKHPDGTEEERRLTYEKHTGESVEDAVGREFSTIADLADVIGHVK